MSKDSAQYRLKYIGSSETLVQLDVSASFESPTILGRNASELQGILSPFVSRIAAKISLYIYFNLLTLFRFCSPKGWKAMRITSLWIESITSRSPVSI